jgi:hypothetical protein
VPEASDRALAGERLRKVRALFDAAMERAPHDRRALVHEAAGSDTALRDEVLALLADEEAAQGFLSEPPAAAGIQSLLVSHEPAGALQESLAAVTAGTMLGFDLMLAEGVPGLERARLGR